MSSWFEKHQRSRAAVDAKKQAVIRNSVDQRAVREASWESRSSSSIEKADIARRIVARKEKLDQQLNNRRHRLAQLLQTEAIAYATEIENSIETDVQRRLRMIEQAKVLQHEREVKRLAEVEKIRAKQFKDGLDEFRVLKTRAIKMQCHRDRLATIQQKPATLRAEQEYELKIHKEYMKIGQKMLDREVREAMELATKNKATRDAVAQQAAAKKALFAAEAEEKQRDVEEWRRRLDEANRAEDEKQKRQAEAKAKNVREMFKEYAQRNVEKALEVDKIKKKDEELLARALVAEAESKKKEMAHTAERAAEAKRFQAFLKKASERKGEDQTALEAVLKAENEKAWAQKEAIWSANRRAKEKLAEEVAEGRNQQVLRRYADAEEALMEKRRTKQEMHEKNARAIMAERAKAQSKQRVVDAYRGDLVRDIEFKKANRIADANKLVQEREQMAVEYQKFDENLKAVMGSEYQPPAHYRKEKVQWYF